MPLQTADEDLARFLCEANFVDEQQVNDFRLEPPIHQQLRLQFTRKSKKIVPDSGNTLNTRRKRRKRGKSKVCNSQDENKENKAASLGRSDESFLQEWHDGEVEIADYRSSDDSQDEQLEEWYKNLKSNKARDVNLPPVNDKAPNVGPVIRLESSNEEKSWLQKNIADSYLLDMLAKYPAADNPREIVCDDLMEPCRWIERTHLIAENMMLTRQKRIFTILRQNRPRNLLAHLRLGYCVTHNPGRPECRQEGRTCVLQCHICGVCCHEYSCTCRLVKQFQWCAHIHAAVLCGGNKFVNDQQVYLHISSRYTQLSHLRATCFDMAKDVKPIEKNEGAFVVMGWTTDWTPYSVLRSSHMDLCHICPQYKRCPECSTCRHQYVCACAEYMVQKRLCEHCHVVAIFSSESRVNTLKRREFRYLSDVSDDTDEEADPRRDVNPIMLPLRKLFAHHEKSYSIPFKRIQVGSVNDQLFYFVRRCDPDRRFVIHTKSRAHCTCSMDWTRENIECVECKMCRHYLTCNCGDGETAFCKHTHAVRRYIIRSCIPTDKAVESVLGRAVRESSSDFNKCWDMAKISCDPVLVTEENITAVVENLKSVLRSDDQVESHNVDELSTLRNDSVESGVKNLEAVLEKVDQMFDSQVASHGKIVPAEINQLNLPSNDSAEGSGNSLKPGLEESFNKESAKVDECAFVEENPQSLQKTNVIGANDLETSLTVDTKSQVGTEQCCHLNDDCTQLNTVKPTPDKGVDHGKSVEEEFGKLTLIDGSLNSDTGFGDWQLNSCSRNKNVGTETSGVGGDEASVRINGSCSSLDSNSQDATNLITQSDGSYESGVGKLDQNEVCPPFNSDSIKAFKSFYELLFRPVIEVRYKNDAKTNEEKHPKVLAESSKCIVTVSDSGTWSPPPVKSVDKCQTMKENENVISKVGGSNLVAKDFEWSNTKESLPKCEPVQVANFSRGLGAKRKDEKVFSTRAGTLDIVGEAKNVEKKFSKKCTANVEPVLFDFNRTFGDFDIGKDIEEFFPKESSGSLDSGIFEGFVTCKDNENLIPKESSGSIDFGKAFREKSMNWMKKLNLVKYFRKPPEEEASLKRFLGGSKLSRSRRQRELAVLQSISEDFEDTSVSFENLELR